MAGPLLIMLILGMMVLPLPPFLLDLLFTFNIALAMIVLLTAMYTLRPLDFAIFPTLLLLTTLLRLSLNVASTRVVLLNGHTGPDAAGKVIEAFGQFLVGGNFAVGFVVFAILVVINFIVITKGAGRIAEVGARFTLDAMPGKQMAIDADLNAGYIDEHEARRRRKDLQEEAGFYGAMDGAVKFTQRDAVASLIVLGVNIVAGIILGVVRYNLPVMQALETYTLLTVGDGLVTVIPSLLISVGGAILTTRSGSDSTGLGSQVLSQMGADPRPMAIAASVLFLFGVVPGLPLFPFWVMGSIFGIMAYAAWKLPTES
ncbi:MAG TPA: FHIPEP family type III secretion protein, partial [Casimicrobiaceae bacterium]